MVTKPKTMFLLVVFIQAFLASPVSTQDQHIVGGQDVDPPGKWPWQGSLMNGGSHSCGCVLIYNPTDPTNNTWAVTAAHCVDSGSTSLMIRFGLHDRFDDDVGSPEDYTIQKIILHPDWTENGNVGFPNDIAILLLDRPANIDNEFIQPIAMSHGVDDYYTDANCFITGWGRLYGNGPLPDILQETSTPTITQEECHLLWSPSYVNYGHICVYNRSSNATGGCNGDSGGPLQCTRDGVNFELVGLTSWVRTGCLTEYPTVYNRVGWYAQWVDCIIRWDGGDDHGMCNPRCPCDSSICDELTCVPKS